METSIYFKQHLSLFLWLFFIIGGHAQMNLEVRSSQFVYENPPFKSCHASTIVEVAPNQFLVAAFGGTKEGDKDVCIWASRSSYGAAWTSPIKVADGKVTDTLRYPTYNPVLFKSDLGTLFLYYKVGPSPSKWWGMYKTSEDDGVSWSDPVKLPDGILGPIKNKPIQLKDGTILSPSSTETFMGYDNWPWKVQIERSLDNGKSWEKIPVDPHSEFNAIQPSILVHGDGRLQLLCRSREQEVLVQSFSGDNGQSWTPLTKTSIDNPNSGTDAVTLSNGWFLLVYNPAKWKGEGLGGRSKLAVAISRDGEQWKDSLILEDETEGEFSYPAVIQARDGSVHITYTHNRTNVKHLVLDIL